MRLINLRVKNFRSLHDVELSDFRQFNVLIGKNNAGKSAVFGALRFLADIVLVGGTHQWGDNILSHSSKSEPLELWLQFELNERERGEVFKSLAILHGNQPAIDAVAGTAFVRKIRYYIASEPGSPASIFPTQIEILSERGNWVSLQKKEKKMDGMSYASRLLDLDQRFQMIDAAARLPDFEKQTKALDAIDKTAPTVQLTLPVNWGREEVRTKPWQFAFLERFLKHSFFFDHFRKFYPEQQVGGEGKLSQDGYNLVEVLHFLSNNHRPTFERIQKFLQSAFDGVGGLETPIKQKSQQTQTAFRSSAFGEQIPLQHMGGGVAQLLMAAVALETTTAEYPIFLEEPETNLHPGAQRFLAERLCDEGRQVFITTHSPTFVNLPRRKSVHKVKMISGRTNIVSLNDETLHSALAEIGARNSDVLLSDAVVFVEGESDLQVVQEWCRISDIPLAGTNTSILVMRSFGRPETALPLRSETLKAIAVSAGIPHLFLLDSDELSEAVRKRIKKDLGDRVHIFEQRELENYLLIPRCIRLAIREKLSDGNKDSSRIDDCKEKQIEKIIRSSADELKNRVLVKRIRSMLEPPPGGFFPRHLFEQFEAKAGRKELAHSLEKALKQRFETNLKNLKLGEIAHEVRKKFDRDWKNDVKRLQLAPGEELLCAVFRNFGTEYEKTTDARRIAKHMVQSDFSPEVIKLLEEIRSLTERET